VTTTSFTLPSNSAPFAPLQSKLAMIDGLNLVCASLNGGSGGQNSAEGGMVALMTGVPTLGQIGQQDQGAGANGAQFLPTGISALSGVDYYIPGDPTGHPHQVLGRTQLEIIKAAFLCDLIRVGTFMWAAGTSNVLFPTSFDGAMLPGYAPLLAAPHYAVLGLEPADTTGRAILAWGAAIDRFYSDQTSQALQAFDAATDLDGNTLLDNTVVVYVNDESTRWDHGQLKAA
jgi:hypothetical protein